MENRIRTMHIDVDGLYVPTRYKAETTVEPDHRSILVTIESGDHMEEDLEENKSIKKWNLRKAAEVNRYQVKTEESEELYTTWRSDNNIQEQYDQWENCVQNILDDVSVSTSKRRKLLASGETKEVRKKMKPLRAKKKQRRDNQRQGICDNTVIEDEIQNIQSDISNCIMEMQCRDKEEKIEEIEKNWRSSIKSDLEIA